MRRMTRGAASIGPSSLSCVTQASQEMSKHRSKRDWAAAIDPALADLGRLLFFDKILGLHNDNSCAGCHAPAFGFGDSQPMAIGVDNNDIVGPSRSGPRNQRRSPLLANTIFYPALMWTPRVTALSGDPFDSPLGFQFPPPENVVTGEPTLLAAQGSLPSTELVEMAGFTGITVNPGPFGPRHFQFSDGHGQALPAPDVTGFHNFPIQSAVDARLNAIPEYLEKFGVRLQRRRPATARWHYDQYAPTRNRRVPDHSDGRERAA